MTDQAYLRVSSSDSIGGPGDHFKYHIKSQTCRETSICEWFEVVRVGGYLDTEDTNGYQLND